MNTLSDRLSNALKIRQRTAADLSRALGISSAGVSLLLNGSTKALKAENLLKASDYLEVSSRWLATGEGPSGLDKELLIDLDAHPGLVAVRTVKMTVQAGVTGITVDAEQSDGAPIYFRADWMRDRGYKPYNLVAFKIKGDSMVPTLFDADTAVANIADVEPKDGKVFAINYEGEAVVKRMFRDGGAWWLSSDNPDQRRFPRRECQEGSCIIIGKVVHRQSEEI